MGYSRLDMMSGLLFPKAMQLIHTYRWSLQSLFRKDKNIFLKPGHQTI
jgi:hypothetical protein